MAILTSVVLSYLATLSRNNFCINAFDIHLTLSKKICLNVLYLPSPTISHISYDPMILTSHGWQHKRWLLYVCEYMCVCACTSGCGCL